MRKLSVIMKEYERITEEYVTLIGFAHDKVEILNNLEKEMYVTRKKYPYGGICEDCGQETDEFCHKRLCLSCCAKERAEEYEMYKEE